MLVLEDFRYDTTSVNGIDVDTTMPSSTRKYSAIVVVIFLLIIETAFRPFVCEQLVRAGVILPWLDLISVSLGNTDQPSAVACTRLWEPQTIVIFFRKFTSVRTKIHPTANYPGPEPSNKMYSQCYFIMIRAIISRAFVIAIHTVVDRLFPTIGFRTIDIQPTITVVPVIAVVLMLFWLFCFDHF